MSQAAVAILFSVISLTIAGLSLVLQFVGVRRGSERVSVVCEVDEDRKTGEPMIRVRAVNVRAAPVTVRELGFTVGQSRVNLWKQGRSERLEHGQEATAGSYNQDFYEHFPGKWAGRVDRVYALTATGREYQSDVPQSLRENLQKAFGPSE